MYKSIFAAACGVALAAPVAAVSAPLLRSPAFAAEPPVTEAALADVNSQLALGAPSFEHPLIVDDYQQRLAASTNETRSEIFDNWLVDVGTPLLVQSFLLAS